MCFSQPSDFCISKQQTFSFLWMIENEEYLIYNLTLLFIFCSLSRSRLSFLNLFEQTQRTYCT